MEFDASVSSILTVGFPASVIDNLKPAVGAAPIPKLPFDEMRSLSLPAVSNVIV